MSVVYKKPIILLVALCVLLAPVLSNAAVSMPVPVAHTQDHGADCHTIKTVDCHASHDGTHSNSTKATHGCCFNFVGILSATKLVEPNLSSADLIPFNPSLSLLSRVEGLYRPPRQLS